RNIKPGFFINEELAECSIWARHLAPGLWCLADREGRLEDRPRRIKGEIFRFDAIEVEPLLQELHDHKHILRYEVEGVRYIQILAFKEHQAPHYSEKESIIPPPLPEHSGKMSSSSKEIPGVLTENVSIKRGSQPPDSLIPDSLIPDSYAALSSAHAPEGDFHKIFDAGCAVNPALMTKSTAVIHQWIADGVTAQDAVPEVRRLAGKARSWSFFTGAVMDAKSTRE